MSKESPRQHFFDHPKNLRGFLGIFFVLCVLLLSLDLVDLLGILPFKEPHFAAEQWFGFYGIFGFLGCTLLVLAAKVLRKIVKRDEDYYDR